MRLIESNQCVEETPFTCHVFCDLNSSEYNSMIVKYVVCLCLCTCDFCVSFLAENSNFAIELIELLINFMWHRIETCVSHQMLSMCVSRAHSIASLFRLEIPFQSICISCCCCGFCCYFVRFVDLCIDVLFFISIYDVCCLCCRIGCCVNFNQFLDIGA